MNIFSNIKEIVIRCVNSIYPNAEGLSAVTVELPKDPSHGDMSTNVALVVRNIGQPPVLVAEKIASDLRSNPIFTDVKVVKPGFINFIISSDVWYEILISAYTAGLSYGNNNLGENRKINVEYVSVNPTGVLHVGHARAIYGDVLAKLLQKCGFDVTREYYINDAGGQITVLSNSTFIRYKQALGHQEEVPEGMYPGEYLIPIGNQLAEKYGDTLFAMSKQERDYIISDYVVGKMMEIIKDDMNAAGINHDVFTSEKHDLMEKGKVEQAIELLEKKNLLYKGILEPPKGKIPDDWEPREQVLFKSTLFGDDVDRPIKKSDGSNTYFAGDIAYHMDKLQRGFKDMVLILGADHGGYVKRMKAVLAALSDNQANIDIKIIQLVNLFKNGEPFKMSKRAGTYITVRDVIEEVGKDVLRFVMLSRKNDTIFDFHFDKVLEQSKDNPVFYVQYAHARAYSVLRMAEEQNLRPSADYLTRLSSDADLALIKKISQYPKVIESAGLSREPHRVTYYLIELANEFHSYWAKGNDEEGMRFVIPKEPELTSARLYLAKSAATTIASGLDILGVKAVERM